MTSATANMGVQASLLNVDLNALRNLNYSVVSQQDVQTVLYADFHDGLTNSYFIPQCTRGSVLLPHLFPHSSTSRKASVCVCVCILDNNHLIDSEMESQCSFDLHFPDD